MRNRNEVIEFPQCTIGLHVTECCRRMVEYQQHRQQSVYVDFNGIRLVADGTKTAEQLAQFYDSESQRRREEYERSNEYKEFQARKAKEVAEMNEQVKVKMEELKTLNFNDYNAVLDWCCAVQPLSDRIGVNVPRTEMIDTFSKHGYYIGMNTKENFKEHDKENYAKYIVGQALDGIAQVGAMHQIVCVFTERWKEKFMSGKEPTLSDKFENAIDSMGSNKRQIFKLN